MIEQTPDPTAMQSTEAPAPALPFVPGQKRTLTPEQLKQWQERIELAWAKAQQFHPQWERALARYAKAKVDATKSSDEVEINALLDFRHVESKKSKVFHRTPEINLLPVDPQDEAVPYDVILPLREKVLNYELGPKRAKAKRAIHKTLIDAIAASAWMACEVGYESVTLPVPADPVTGIAPTNPDGTPMVVPIWARRFISAISSKKLLVPDDFHDTDFDEAPWLGYKGSIPLSQARRLKWEIPADYKGSQANRDVRYTHSLPAENSSDPAVPYTKVWLKAAHFDDTVPNPDCYRCLVLVEGLDQPAWYVDSPLQTMLPTGELSDDSLIGNPIHMDSIRDLIDAAYVPSDLVVGEQLSVEVNRFRTGLMRNRRARRPITLVNDRAGTDLIGKVAENAGPIPTPDEFFDGAGGQRLVAVVQGGTEPRDNYTAQEKCEQDWESAIGTDPNGAGNFSRTRRTATEVRNVQGNSSARAETDRDRVAEWAEGLFVKYDVVLQRTATQQELTKILGQQGAVLWQQWRNLPGRFSYKIQPDAGQYIDAREYRAQALDTYNLLRKDPAANGVEILKDTVRALGKDAAKLVAGEVKEKPDQPKVSISFNAEQALQNPAEMQLLLTMLKQSGYQIPPEMETALTAIATLRQEVAAMQQTAPQPTHPGAADRTEPLNQHARQKTGGIQGAAA